MEDLSAMLGQILGSEEGMAQLKSVADMLGLSGEPAQEVAGEAVQAETATQQASVPDLSALASMLSGLAGSGQSQPQQQAAAPSLPSIDPSTILMIQRAYSAYSQPNDNSALLLALKPHLKDERQKKVDDAIKIMGLLRVYPLIKESGLLSNIIGDSEGEGGFLQNLMGSGGAGGMLQNLLGGGNR